MDEDFKEQILIHLADIAAALERIAGPPKSEPTCAYCSRKPGPGEMLVLTGLGYQCRLCREDGTEGGFHHHVKHTDGRDVPPPGERAKGVMPVDDNSIAGREYWRGVGRRELAEEIRDGREPRICYDIGSDRYYVEGRWLREQAGEGE